MFRVFVVQCESQRIKNQLQCKLGRTGFFYRSQIWLGQSRIYREMSMD